MFLFWRHGYEATSVGELTAAMGITAPSLYAAFGDKKALFLESVQRYTCGLNSSRQIIREAATAQAAAETLLLTAATGFTRPGMPPGCLLISAAMSCSDEAQDVQLTLSKIRSDTEAELLAKIKKDVAAGRLPVGTPAAPLAALTMGVIYGMSTLARDGAKRIKLIAMAKTTMNAWPLTMKAEA